MILKPKPWWLSLLTSKTAWVTIYPNIYYPKGLNPDTKPYIIKHELVHIKQQSDYGKWKWLWRYVTNKAFRLDQEAKAIAVEISSRPELSREYYIVVYAKLLSGIGYWHCADSSIEAADAIQKEMRLLS